VTTVASRFEQLLDRLARHVGKPAAIAPLTPEGLQLRRIIYDAGRAYAGVQRAEHAALASTLHELADPLPRVVVSLRDEANREQLLVMLGAPAPVGPMTWPERDRPAVERADARRRSLLRELETVAGALPPTPTVPRHRPSRTKGLRAAVEVLVDGFEHMSGERFSQLWHRGDAYRDGGDGRREKLPATRGTQFVRDAMQLIDPQRLGDLPGVTRAIVEVRGALR